MGFTTRRKVLKVAKIKDANYGCKDEGNESVSQLSINQPVVRGVCDVVDGDVSGDEGSVKLK